MQGADPVGRTGAQVGEAAAGRVIGIPVKAALVQVAGVQVGVVEVGDIDLALVPSRAGVEFLDPFAWKIVARCLGCGPRVAQIAQRRGRQGSGAAGRRQAVEGRVGPVVHPADIDRAVGCRAGARVGDQRLEAVRGRRQVPVPHRRCGPPGASSAAGPRRPPALEQLPPPRCTAAAMCSLASAP